MPLDELIGYLRSPHDLDLAPYADLLSQTEQMGDPALPCREHTALLRWVGEAMHNFEQRFPLAEPLASQVRRLKPLAATLALLDPDFMQPDVHPLHQLLDAIQERAVGWQSNLGRTGALLEQQLATAVDGALAWFDDHNVDLAAVCAQFLAAAERDRSRAERMSRRVVETEVGRLRTATAKRQAALMINALLEKYPAPEEIGAFLRGHWFSSAQLLLLKFGADSEQWRMMSETTESLLDSVQSLENVPEERRQHIFAIVTQLPKDMRRWLLNLHHDTEAVNEAMAIIESAHLRILRRQPVELVKTDTIPVEAMEQAAPNPELVKALRPIEQGQWFAIDSGGQGTDRAQLVLKDENVQRLLFTNMAGVKVLDYSFEEFDRVLEQKRVTALPAGGGFSLCLAIAAGVDSTEKLDALYLSLSGQHADASTSELPAEEPAGAAEARVEDTPEDDPPPATTALRQPGTEPATDALLNAQEMEELEALIDDGEPLPTQGPGADTREQANEAADRPHSRDAGKSTDADCLNLPMGAWLGFHDGETPLMAKLAVHDPQDDTYTFVNRQGIKMRQTTGIELAALISKGLVDILQTNPSFRHDVDAARRELDD